MSACTCPCPTCGTSGLTTLRAEVEALRDRCLGAEGRWTAAGLPSAGRAPTSTAYQTVLNLIDKHAREGQ